MSTTETLSAALAKAQGEMKNAPLNKVNPHFKNRYADLAAIRDATVPSLSKHGLSISQRFGFRDQMFVLITELRHLNGETLESVCPLPMNVSSQQLGSATTYARRYSWSAICGISADEDDDAEADRKAQTNGNGAKPHGMKAEPPKYKLGDHGGQIADKANWKGPLKVGDLKAAISQLRRDIHGCADMDQLNALVHAPETKALAEQAKVDLAQWWNGEGDILGIVDEIKRMKEALMAMERA